MEAGDYDFLVGTSSRDVTLAARLTLDKTVETEHLTNICPLLDALKEIQPEEEQEERWRAEREQMWEEKKAEIMKVLEAIKAEKGYAASYLMVTDILAEDTFLWFTEGAESIVEKAFAGKPENGVAYLPHVMSRKKQVTPPLLKAYGE